MRLVRLPHNRDDTVTLAPLVDFRGFERDPYTTVLSVWRQIKRADDEWLERAGGDDPFQEFEYSLVKGWTGIQSYDLSKAYEGNDEPTGSSRR